MYAIIRTGGKQYRVNEGDVLKIEKLPQAKDDKVVFTDVLMIGDEKTNKVGTPLVKDATVEGKVLSIGKSEKVIIFKYKSKKDYRKKQGHRQPFSEVEIEKILLGKAKKEAAKPEVKEEVAATDAPAKKAPAKKAPAKKVTDTAQAAKPAAKKAPAKKAVAKDEAIDAPAKKAPAKKAPAKKAAVKKEEE